MTSDLDIVLTPPTGTTKSFLTWAMSGEVNANGSTGFLVYRDVDGGGFTILPNCKTGTDYWEVITTPSHGGTYSTTPQQVTVSIIDESPEVASVNTYRLYVASTAAALAGYWYLNRSITAPASSNEAMLTTFKGECI